MDEKICQGQLMRPSLGRLGFIGELYDIRTESLSSRSLLKSSFPAELIERRDIEQMEYEYKLTENISDRFEMLKVEAEVQVSVILGLIGVEGSGKFLTESKKSHSAVSCSLICKLLKVSEKLFASFAEIVPHIDLSVLSDPQYTHVIFEINWGANCLLSLESNHSIDHDKQEIEGELALALDKVIKILSLGGSGDFEKKDLTWLRKNNISIKISADVASASGWPTTVEGFCQFVTEIPKLIKTINNGKGKPLNYVMIPLHTFQKLAKLENTIDVLVKKIDESFLLSTIYFFEEISQIKQKLHDALEKMKDNKKYVADEELKKTRKQLETLSIKESQLKSLISDDWVLVRSGKKSLKDLIKGIERFKNYDLNLFAFEDFLESCEPIFKKLSIVKNYVSKGIIYLGKEEKLDQLITKYLSFEFIVLVISSEMEEADPELYRNTCYYFMMLAVESRPNTKYVIVDFDFRTEEKILNTNPSQAKCYHLKGSKVLSWDLYTEYLLNIENNFARLRENLVMEYTQHKPGNRVVLEITCPGFETGTCPPEQLKWHCYRCKNYLEYGFDDYFYCPCGRGLADSFQYRCSNAQHDNVFILASPEFLRKALSSLRPLKELNLLVLGQSGVGKSTWINSIINYLSYESLDDAKENGVITTIPLSFTMYDANTLKKHTIEIGDVSENENTNAGASATQNSHTYSFRWMDRHVRVIDTPGLGDTRGIIKDKDNLKNVIDHIGYLKELHGVCILFKANDNRINAYFSYCLKELLANLHRSVAKNIVFCFTNARNSFYTPGQTSTILEKVIDGLGVKKDLALGRHNMFCLDNEAFLFLCSLQNPEIHHDENLVKSFTQSWEISLNETLRLFNTIKTFEPHLMKETLSLVTARSRVLSLTKPLAEISKTIQINVAAMERKKKDILTSEQTIEELSKKLNFTVLELKPVPLERPRTVCTSPSCVNYINHGELDVSDIEYKTHCHVECYLEKVTPKTVNNAQLKNCFAMDSGVCRVCKCSWENHMHLTYSQERVQKVVVNKNVQEDMLKEKSEKEKVENFVSNLKKTVDEYKKEQEVIIQTCVKFGLFLRRNAISLYNDSVEDYLSYLIKTEENKLYKSTIEKVLLQKLKETLDHYKAEVQILEEVIEKGKDEAEELTVQQVYELEQQLYKLKLTGEDIRKCVEINRSANTKVMDYGETSLRLTIDSMRRKNFKNKDQSKIFQKIKNCIFSTALSELDIFSFSFF